MSLTTPESVRVGIFGTGFARHAHLPAFRHTPGAEVVAIYSSPLSDAQAAAAEINMPSVYDDWRQMIAEADLMLADVAVPPFLHSRIVMAALEAGCHVLSEKPMALNVAEAQAMYAAAQSRGVIHMVDHQLRFCPTYRRAKQLLDEGFIGRLYHARYHNLTTMRSNPDAPWTWLSDAGTGGGNLMGGASHAVDLIRWLFGEVNAVSGQLATWIEERPLPGSAEMRTVTSDDQYSIVMEMNSGAMVWLFGSSVARHPVGLRLEMVGSEGTLIISDEDDLWGARTGDELQELTVPDPNAMLDGVPGHVWGVSFVGAAREMVSAIREGRPLAAGATFYDGMRTQAILDATRHSWTERCWVPVPTD